MGKHRPEEIAKEKERLAEIARRSRKAIITIGKRPRLTPSDTDPRLQLPSRPIRSE